MTLIYFILFIYLLISNNNRIFGNNVLILFVNDVSYSMLFI